MFGGRDGGGMPGGSAGRGMFGGKEGSAGSGMFGGGGGKGMLGGGGGGGSDESIIAGIELRTRTVDALFGFIGGMGGATVGGGDGVAIVVATPMEAATGGLMAIGGVKPPELKLELRASTALTKKSFDGVAPAKYEFEVATGGEGRMVMLVRLCERNGAGSERICMLVGRRRARAC